MSRTREDLMDAAIQVSNAGDGENTKERIGGILYDISDHLPTGSLETVSSSTGGLRIEVVETLPSPQEDNVIYIVQRL